MMQLQLNSALALLRLHLRFSGGGLLGFIGLIRMFLPAEENGGSGWEGCTLFEATISPEQDETRVCGSSLKEMQCTHFQRKRDNQETAAFHPTCYMLYRAEL